MKLTEAASGRVARGSSGPMAGFAREAVKSGNRIVLRLAIVAAIGGFLFGYDTGVISGALLYIKKDLHATSFEQQAIVGALLLGAVAGAVLAGYSADALSRRWTKIIAGGVYVVGALVSAVSQTTGELIAARFVLGVAVGCASFVSPMYIAELAPKKIRGGTVSFNQLMIVSGILAAYIVNFLLKDATGNWRWMLGLGAVPGAALAIGMLFQPYSPRWLLEKGREDEARAVLQRVRGRGDDIDEEVESIKEVAAEQGKVALRDLLRPRLRPMLTVGLGLAIFQQIIGINTVIYYAPTILSQTGAAASKAVGQTVFIGVTNVVLTVVAVLLIDRFGRRVFLLIGTAGCVLSLLSLGAYFEFGWLQHNASWLALASLIVYIASFAVGLGPVFWLMISEIFPLRVRSGAMSVCTVANWGFNFLVSFTFLSLVSAIGRPWTFWLYAAIGVGALAFFASQVPETKDRALEQIEEELGADAQGLGRVEGGLSAT